MTLELTPIRRVFLIALILFMVAIGGAMLSGAMGLSDVGPGQVLSLRGDPDAISWDESVWASWAGSSGSVLVS